MRCILPLSVLILALGSGPVHAGETEEHEPGVSHSVHGEEHGGSGFAEVDLAVGNARLMAHARRTFARADFSAAMLYFEELLRRRPEHRLARNYLVECYRALGFDSDADAILAGALPVGEPTPVRSASMPPEHTRPVSAPSVAVVPAGGVTVNRRQGNLFELGAGLLGPSVGLGVVGTFQPVWLVAVSAGVGGLGLPDTEDNIVSVFVEVQLRVLPMAITPTVSFGGVAVGGERVARFDPVFAASEGAVEDGRSYFYVSFGARYDFKDSAFVEAGCGFVRSALAPHSVVPFPGFRGGLRF